MESGVTPYVWSTVAKYGAITTSFEMARQTLKDWGVKISLKRIERLTYRFGAEGLSNRNSKILALEKKISNCSPQQSSFIENGLGEALARSGAH